jgi:hypothetical protein
LRRSCTDIRNAIFCCFRLRTFQNLQLSNDKVEIGDMMVMVGVLQSNPASQQWWIDASSIGQGTVNLTRTNCVSVHAN